MLKYTASFFYVIWTCISNILITHINLHISPIYSLLFCVTLAVLFFNAISLSHLKENYQVLLRQWPLSLTINITMIGVWFSTFYALKWVDPFTFTFFYFCIPVIFSAIAQGYTLKSWIHYGLGLIIIVTLYLYLVSLHDTYVYFVDGVVTSIIGGTSSFFYRKYSQIYAKRNQASPSVMLSVRSYGILVCCLFFVFKGFSLHSLPVITEKIAILLICVAICSFIIPLYLNQKGINNSGHIIHSCIAAFIPVMSWGVSWFFGILHEYNQHIGVLLIATIASAIMLAMNYIREHAST